MPWSPPIDRDAAEAALVAVATARPPQSGEARRSVDRADLFDAEPQAVDQRAVRAERIDDDLADVIERVAGAQAGLVRDERDRAVGDDRDVGDVSGVGIDAARHVDREDRPAARVDELDPFAGAARRRAGEADAEQPVDDERRVLDRVAGIDGRLATVAPSQPRVLRVAAQALGVVEQRDAHADAAFVQNARGDERVAAVVAGTGQQQDRPRALGGHSQRGPCDRIAGAFHQATLRLAREQRGFERADGGDAQQPRVERRRSISHSARASARRGRSRASGP